MLVCYDKSECWTRKYDGKSSGEIDASIVTTYIINFNKNKHTSIEKFFYFSAVKSLTIADCNTTILPLCQAVYYLSGGLGLRYVERYRTLDTV